MGSRRRTGRQSGYRADIGRLGWGKGHRRQGETYPSETYKIC